MSQIKHLTSEKNMKRLIEVDLPIKRISAHARREKSIRHGHISTLHIWWARRPLAACRAVLCAALWPDPMDDQCPQSFRNKAAELITHFAKKVDDNLDLLALCDVESRKRWTKLAKQSVKHKVPLDVTTVMGTFPLRQYLLDFIADFANWDCSKVPLFLETARALTQSAHEALGGAAGIKPLVVDPFAGGGSIPLEALRVGADAFASDLNPVAVLLNKVVLEYIPKYGTKLAEEVRKWGTWIKEQAEKELAEFYPKDSDGAMPIAYLWARTIRCEGPNCGAEVPLVRSLWLAKKANRSIGLQMLPRKDKTGVDFEVIGKVASDEWRVMSEEDLHYSQPATRHFLTNENNLILCNYEYLKIVSGIDSLAKINRIDRKDLLLYAAISERRDVWNDLANEKIGGVDSKQHRGGTGQEFNGGISPISGEFQRFFVRIGDTIDHLAKGGIHDRAGIDELVGNLRRNKQAAQWIDEVIGKVASDEWRVTSEEDSRHSPLTTHHSFDGTVHRGNATCPCCGFTTPVAHVREQLKKRHGGANDARLMCVVTTRPGQQGRFYRLPTQTDLDAVKAAEKELEKRKKVASDEWRVVSKEKETLATHLSPLATTLSLVPEEPTPMGGGSGAGRAFSQRNYGMNLFCDLFSSRQLLALTTLSRLVREIVASDEWQVVSEEENTRHSSLSTRHSFLEAVQNCLGIMVDRQADALSSLVRWRYTVEAHAGTFGRQALSMMWDFVEIFPFSGATGCFDAVIEWVAEVLEASSILESSAHVSCSSATRHPLPDGAAQGFITDPPYYDAVPYADLSDFFLVWLKRSIPDFFYQETLTPKKDECIVDEVKGKDKAYFESTMKEAMKESRRVLSDDGIGVVVFAHKSTAGWEAQLQSMIEAGWIITGSWPIDTERPGRLRAQGSAALASSVHLVCRPRIGEPIGDWRDVITALPQRIHAWMPRLAKEGVVAADAIFACLGPALEIFSQYSKVEKANGDVVPLREYLELVWGAISKEALSMIFKDGDTAGFEEDARLTSIWLWTLGTSDELRVESGEQEEEEDETLTTRHSPLIPGATLLDRVHQCMLLFAAGRSDALKRFLVDEEHGKDAKLWKLAQSLSALYPGGSNEKRWVDGVLARKKGLGF